MRACGSRRAAARAEAELARLRAAAEPRSPHNVECLLPPLAKRYRALADQLGRSLTETDVDTARAELRTLFGSIRVVSDEREVRFEVDLRETHVALLRAVDPSANNVGSRSPIWDLFSPAEDADQAHLAV